MSDLNREYAEALFALAMEVKQEQAYLDALRLIGDALEAEPEYVEVLSAPSIPGEERTALLEQAFGAAVPEQVLSFVQLICAHGRIRSLSDCIDEYHHLYQAAMALSTAHVVSAVGLTDDQKARLAEKLSAKFGRDITLVCTVDEHLLGGITVRIDGVVLDGSLRRRLQEVKDVIEQ